MKKSISILAAVAVVSLLPVFATAADEGPVAWWKFDTEGNIATDSVSGIGDKIRGNFGYAEGVSGKCLKFDENTTVIVRKGDNAPGLAGSFTIEAWVAPQAYPWNWCPIVMHRQGDRGYYFGVDGDARFGLGVSVDGKWYECNSKMPFAGLHTQHQWNSDERAWTNLEGTPGPPEPFTGPGKPVVPLLKWSHLVGVFDESEGITIYLNGKQEAELDVGGKLTPAQDAPLRIGRDTKKMRPAHTERPRFTFPINYSFDGLVDEIKIYNRALSPAEVVEAYKKVQPGNMQTLKFRKIPTGPKGPKPFGAYFTKLEYDEDYDRPWRIGDYADVVVMFDEHPFKLVYWHGINNYPVWYSENDIGLMHEAGETHGPLGCQEALMDRQCRYSRVRVIENSDARVVIHWRHAMNDIEYELAHVDPITGWGDWADEYWTIYPDGVAVRHLERGWIWADSWVETMFYSEPGTKPEDNVQLEACTLVNLAGESKTYSWEAGSPECDLADPIISMVNSKSTYKPFNIYPTGSSVKTFGGHSRGSHFHWWNHFPVSQIVSDGRGARAPDRAAHSSLVWGTPSTNYLMYGLTNKPAASLINLAKSWNMPASISEAAGCMSEGYAPVQRAYILTKTSASMSFRLFASESRPVVNPCFVIENWGSNRLAGVKIGGRPLSKGPDFRQGIVRDTNGTQTMVIWLKREITEDVRIAIEPIGG